MKKLILSLAALAACISTAHAQSEDNHFGVKVGGNYSTLVGSDVTSDAKGVFGFHAGFLANIDLTERFSIQPELLYSMKGVKLEGGGITATQRLNYVELPIMVKAKFNQFFIEVGPQASALVSAKQKVSGAGSDAEESNKDLFNTVDVGYAAGLGYQMDGGLMVGARYNGGFTNVLQAQLVGTQNVQQKARNSAFQVYVGYTFGGK